MNHKRIHTIYSMILSIALIAAGICLILACVGIYRSGDHPFSPEAVAAAFAGIAVPVYLCLALILGGFLLDIFLPLPAPAKHAVKQNNAILQRLLKTFDEEQCYSETVLQIHRLETGRKLHRILGIGILVICSAVFLAYGLNGSNFHQSEINASMVKAMWVFLPCLLIPFGYAVWNAYYQKRSIIKQIELVRQAPKKAAEAVEAAPKHKNPLFVIRLALLVLCIGILLYGFFTGGTQDVLTKAVNICTECVGLG